MRYNCYGILGYTHNMYLHKLLGAVLSFGVIVGQCVSRFSCSTPGLEYIQSWSLFEPSHLCRNWHFYKCWIFFAEFLIAFLRNIVYNPIDFIFELFCFLQIYKFFNASFPCPFLCLIIVYTAFSLFEMDYSFIFKLY